MSKGFFADLEPMDGALQAIHEMQADGLKLYICTAPLRYSSFCAQEKIDWVRHHLGDSWLDSMILCQDKV